MRRQESSFPANVYISRCVNIFLKKKEPTKKVGPQHVSVKSVTVIGSVTTFCTETFCNLSIFVKHIPVVDGMIIPKWQSKYKSVRYSNTSSIWTFCQQMLKDQPNPLQYNWKQDWQNKTNPCNQYTWMFDKQNTSVTNPPDSMRDQSCSFSARDSHWLVENATCWTPSPVPEWVNQVRFQT